MDSGKTELTTEHADHPALTTTVVAPTPGLRLVLADGVRLRVTVPAGARCFPLSNEHPAHTIDEQTYELSGLPTELPFELVLACTASDQTIHFRRTLQPPLPESISAGPSPVRTVRLELVDQAGRAAPRTPLWFETLGDRSAQTSFALMTDDAGVASLEIPMGPRLLQFTTFTSGHVARHWWQGEEVLRLTLRGALSPQVAEARR